MQRDDGHSVIAGYPWFLDWGRDTLICCRGYLAAGEHAAVRSIVLLYARYVDRGTLPNCIHGADLGNRDTSDAPLWLGAVAADFLSVDPDFLNTPLATGKSARHPFGRPASRRPGLCLWHAEWYWRRRRQRFGLQPKPFYLDGHELSGGHPKGWVPT